MLSGIDPSVLGLILERIEYFHLFFIASGDTTSLSVVKSLLFVILYAMVIALKSEVVEKSHLSLLVH